MRTDQNRIGAKRLLDYVQKRILKSLREGEEDNGWDPDEVLENLSRTIEETLPADSPFRIKIPTREQLVALRLMGKDIKNSLPLALEFTPPSTSDFIDVQFRLGDKIE